MVTSSKEYQSKAIFGIDIITPFYQAVVPRGTKDKQKPKPAQGLRPNRVDVPRGTQHRVRDPNTVLG